MRRLALVGLAALAFPASAFAHASLQHTWPPYGTSVGVAPKQLRLEFDQAVKVFPNSIRVMTMDGHVLSGTVRSENRGHDVVVPLRHLPRGGYTVRWSALSSDGHTVSGVFTFGVRVAAPPVLQAYGSSGPTRTEDVVRWLYFLSLALFVGGMAFRLLAVPGPLPPRAEKRFFAVTGIGIVAALEVGIAAFLLRAEDALQLPFGKLLYGDLAPIANGTRFGVAFIAMTLGFALVAALAYLSWLTDRRWLLWPALLLGAGFASGLSLSGHSAADYGHSWLSELADWVHLCAAAVWIGGLVQLVAVVWPSAPELRRTALLRFSRLATVCIAVIIAAGVYLSILRLPHLHDLWTAGYGQVLIVKLSLVSVALLWGAIHRFLAVPAVEQGDERVLGRMGRSLVGEVSVGMTILLLAAILVDSKPPSRQPAPAPNQAASVRR